MLIFLILSYCSDCFNNMEQKYLKMNQALFKEMKSRLKSLTDKWVFGPANLAFKSTELNEMIACEAPDFLARKPANRWLINDLILFVDSKGTPRIPVQLFHEVLQIPSAGVPGPIYRGYIEVFQQLFKTLLFVLFVFIIILSFSSVYKISETSQTLATLVGGFFPRMLGMFTPPPSPDVQLETVHFSCHMDVTTRYFYQFWPIHDLPFEVISDQVNDQNAEAVIDICLPKWLE